MKFIWNKLKNNPLIYPSDNKSFLKIFFHMTFILINEIDFMSRIINEGEMILWVDY